VLGFYTGVVDDVTIVGRKGGDGVDESEYVSSIKIAA
jgi:hypothetical protein